MFGSQTLDTAIGLVFVLLLVSILVTTVNELISAVFRSRAKWLRIGIDHLLGPDWAAKLYAHPLILGSTKDGTGPSYIPSETYAMALLDLIYREAPSIRVARNALEDALGQTPTGTGTLDAFKTAVRTAAATFDKSSKATVAIRSGLDALLDSMPPAGVTNYTVGDAKNDVRAFASDMS